MALLSIGRIDAPPTARAEAPKSAVDFNRKVRPILSEYCFACHGPDEKQRKAKLRLDTREGAFGKLKDGGLAIVPGKSKESELITRITAPDAIVMPPKKSAKHLKPEQIELLRQWIDEGASWSEHWALAPLKRAPLPTVTQAGWIKNPIDRFILARLEKTGLQPAPEAERTTLLRRVTLDLTGLPPTPAEVDAFLADTAPNAYEKVVDRLLQSPRYGEHMTRFWLDVARYGDTHGLHLDNYREIWLYRDWVLRAFNGNMPFDRFVVEQLAGDLLPNPTLEQIVATGFNRCHVTTSEGGSIEEEVYVRNVVDRVETTGTVFLGMSVGCARCHDHKYDPITMKDFYALFAFFNSIDGKPLDGNIAQHPPILRMPTPEQAAAQETLKQKLVPLQKQLADSRVKIKYEEPADADKSEEAKRAEFVWIDDSVPTGAKPQGDANPQGVWNWVSKPEHPVYSGAKSMRRESEGLSQHFFTGAAKGLRVGAGDTLFAYVYLDPAKPPKEIMLQWHTDGWKHRAYWGENIIQWGIDNTPDRFKGGALPAKEQWVRVEVDAAKVGIKPGQVITGWAFTQHGGVVYWDKAGIVTKVPQADQPFYTLAAWVRVQKASGSAGLPKPIQDIIKFDAAKRNDAQKKQLLDYFIENAYAKTRPIFEPLRKQIVELEKQRTDLDKQVPATLIYKEMSTPRPAYILKRGEYDQRGEAVGRATPGFLPPLPDGLPRDRLGLARWLVSPTHPLTARVAVNRFWQQGFGTGIVKTTEDVGSQGEPPSHPELLDWLALQFIEEGWNVKKFMKQLVMSATYRQSSKVTPERLAKDPANRLLSRGPRFRLDAEMLRDQALSVSGLLVEKLGGPSVKPPQPAGLWEAVGYVSSNTRNFVADSGHERVHRRSLYTFWKRTAPPPQMSTFDAPSREACVVRRERTNTPLQALLLLNETQYIEAARVLAERTLRQGGDQLPARIAFMFKLAAGRTPDTRELAELVSTYNDHLAVYVRDVDAARKLITVGESKPDAALNASELAAMTMIANLVLNLDEVLTKG